MKYAVPVTLRMILEESKHCISSRISNVKWSRESCALKLDKTSIRFPVDSIAQLVEQRSGIATM